LIQVTFVTKPVSVTALASLTHWASSVHPVRPNISLEIFEGGLVPPFILLYIAFNPGLSGALDSPG